MTAGDDHHQAARLEGVLRPDPAAPDVGLGLARAREVGVFLVPQDHQVGGEQPDDERREEELVDDEQPRR